MNFLYKISLYSSAVGGIIFLYKTYFGVPTYDGKEDLAGKVAIVTGASSGIGKEIAYQLAKRNATLIMACRNNSECRLKRTKIFTKTGNKEIYCSELDLNNFDSVKEFVDRMSKKMQKVDIVVHNAGVKSGARKEVSDNYIEQQMSVNTMAPFLLNKLLLPLLSHDARVITLICPQYKSGSVNVADPNFDTNYNCGDAFAQSQLMRTLLSVYLSKTTKNVRYITCDPGPTNSPFHRKMAYNNNFVSRNIFRIINLYLLRNMWQAVETPVMCCCSPSVTSGSHYRDLELLPLEDIANDESMARYVYSLCDKWTSHYTIRETKIM